MICKPVWSSLAANDLLSVWNGVFEASRNPELADRYTAALKETVLAQAAFPRTGFPLYYGSLFTGFYSVNYKAYKVFYRIREERMEILRVLPAASDHLRILFPAD